MNLDTLNKIIEDVVREEMEYQQLFKLMLSKTGKDINSMSDEDKKKFFTAVDKAYKAKTEGRLIGYKENINEGFIAGLLTLMSFAIIGKIIFYFFVQLVEKGLKYFSSNDKKLKDIIKNILQDLSNNKSFIDDVSTMINKNKGIDEPTAAKIVKMGYTQSLIKKYTQKGDVKNDELETELKNIFYKAWKDSSIESNISNKIQKDIK